MPGGNRHCAGFRTAKSKISAPCTPAVDVSVVSRPPAPPRSAGRGRGRGSGSGGRLPDSEMLCGFVFSDKNAKRPDFGSAIYGDKQLAAGIRQSAADIAGKLGRLTVMPVSAKRGARRILLAGLGEKGGVTADDIRHVSGRIAKRAKDLKLASFAVVAPGLGSALRPDETASAIAEGAIMSMYRFDRFKSSDDDSSGYGDDYGDDDNGDAGGPSGASRPQKKGAAAPPATDPAGIVSDLLSAADRDGSSGDRDPELFVVMPGIEPGELDRISESVRASVSTSRGNLFVRSVANLPPNVCTPQMLADIARGIAKKNRGRNIKCIVISKSDLQRRGFGGITAVGQGSKNEPKLIILEYMGRRPADGAGADDGDDDDDAGPIVLVGKAVTFDTGGISLKPGANMDEMKFDKCGGCTVLGIMKTAAELEINADIIGIVPAVENMPGGESYRPGDIIRLYSGKTAEILNTDAEGRLILADALAYGERHYSPREIIDFATLTGACIVALGTNVAGMVSNDGRMADAIMASSERTAEPVWRLPLDDVYMDMIKSPVADMKNMGVGRAAGTIAAAAFLKNAIRDTPWVHLDIAGVAWTQTATRPRSYKSKGATGFGLRLVMDHLSGLAQG